LFQFGGDEIAQFLQKMELNWDKIKIQGPNSEWENDTWHNCDTWHCHDHVAQCQLDTWQIFNFLKILKKIN